MLFVCIRYNSSLTWLRVFNDNNLVANRRFKFGRCLWNWTSRASRWIGEHECRARCLICTYRFLNWVFSEALVFDHGDIDVVVVSRCFIHLIIILQFRCTLIKWIFDYGSLAFNITIIIISRLFHFDKVCFCFSLCWRTLAIFRAQIALQSFFVIL